MGKNERGERVLTEELVKELVRILEAWEEREKRCILPFSYKSVIYEIIAKFRTFSIIKILSIASPTTRDQTVDKTAKWLAALVENGELYDGFENMAWSEFAGGEETADAFRGMAAELLYTYLPIFLGVAERVKKHPPEKRVPAGRERGR